MADQHLRSSRKEAHGPRAVRPSRGSTTKSQRSKHDSVRTSTPRKDTTSRRRPAAAISNLDGSDDRSSFDLHIMSQPQRIVALGMPVSIAAVLSTTSSNDSASGLMACVSVVSENSRTPLEANTIAAQSLMDTPHTLTSAMAQQFDSSGRDGDPLGYFAFQGLVIRESGNFRLRITLMQVARDGGIMYLTSADSEPIRVERPVIRPRRLD